ncbi:MAG: OmpA family protein [Nevskiaceae bacterium]|nr:MAG: OmpA family protein [Nevskiaceae bacterium]TBR75085.1 MAG: OmpA family protein [Nevskiaceae bacterium]
MRHLAKKFLVVPAVGLAFMVGAVSAQAQDESTTPPDTRFYVAPSFTYDIARGSRHTRNGVGGQLEIGKSINDFVELALIGFYEKFPLSHGDRVYMFNQAAALGLPNTLPTSARLFGGGFGANFFVPRWLESQNQWLRPLFLHGDVMYGHNSEQKGVTNDSKGVRDTSLITSLGVGYDISLDPLLNRFITGSALRLEALYRIDHRERNFLGPNAGSRTIGEPVFTAGVRIPLGPAPVPPPPPPPPKPEPVAVVPVQAPPPPPPCEAPVLGQPFSLEGCKVGDSFALAGVNFEFDKSRLEPHAVSILDMVAQALNDRKGVSVELDGYTDSIGSSAYNVKLSDRRANIVKQYLSKHGVAASRMEAKGFGMADPVADNGTAEGRAKNRRTEVKITKIE